MDPRPIPFRWGNGVMAPFGRFAKVADKQYQEGQIYTLEVVQERNMGGHRGYFAGVAEAWKHLRDDLHDQYPSADALRKKALIKAGYRVERDIVLQSEEDALTVAAALKELQPYDVVVVRGAVVKHMRAKSQSVRAMGKKEFEESCRAVEKLLAELIGTDTETMKRESAAWAAYPKA